MSAPTIITDRATAERVYAFPLHGGEPMTDGQNRRFQPRHLSIKIYEHRLIASVSGTHIKANGEIGAAHRSVHWSAIAGEPSQWQPREIPTWVVRQIAVCLANPIGGPPLPTAWAAQLLPSENE